MSFCKQMVSVHFRLILVLVLILLSATLINQTLSSPMSSSRTKSVCKSTSYPDVCFDSLKLSVSLDINVIFIQSLKVAISEAVKLLSLLSNTDHGIDIIEKQKGTIQDCNQLHQITVNSLNKSLARLSTASAPDTLKLADINAYLAAAVTNKNTCLEGLQSASGPLKPLLVGTIIAAYKHVSNCLSLLSAAAASSGSSKTVHVTDKGMTWLSRKDSNNDTDNDDDDDDDYNTLTVAADGSGNFTTITDAINFAPNNSVDRIIIYIKQGLYEENVEIPSYKPNIVLLGEGSDTTLISGNRSVIDGWTTFRSATVGNKIIKLIESLLY